jgi:hypothetical protein
MVGLVHSGVTAAQFFFKTFICGENSPFFFFLFFSLKKKKSQATWSKELYEKIPKNSHIWKFFFSKKKKAIIFGGFGQISGFLLLKSPYLN